ncbi:amidase [Dactylonectria estremocensis]|uniref:Amidase n=1 Tax=Dactylonectria estremocensis TaxID=1079267 RepID=A0A9P9E3F2_9HYPO|nr:amidase [Dactylonectria estremocensis]
MASPELYGLTASEVQRRIQSNELLLEDYVQSLLARYRARDKDVNAWACIEPENVLKQARQLDQIPPEKRGRLHGFVIGVKDVMLTKDLPTGYNSQAHTTDGPLLDASSVAILRRNGALIMGKTRTTEFAATTVGPGTKNPHDPSRSPGGSSSGTGAGVADKQIPIGLGTQTVGSVIRPSSFNGIFGLKPTWNAISAEGQKVSSVTLDTFGFMGRSIEDLQALADVFSLRDDELPKPVHLKKARFALVKTPVWPKAGPGTIAAMERAAQILKDAGATVEEVTLPSEFDNLLSLQNQVLQAEAGVAFYREYNTTRDKMSDKLVDMARNIDTCSKKDFLRAFDTIASLRPKIDEIADRYTAILTPSTVDVAPVGIEWTGSSDFNGIWTALHTPVLNVPGLGGENGMPVGISFVTSRYRDQHLLQVGKAVGPLFADKGGWKSDL